MQRSTTRRQLIKSAVGGAALASMVGARPAWAEERMVIGNWGGDSQGVLEKFVSPTLKDKGIETVFDTAAEPARKVKILAERPLPRGTLDVGGLTDAGAYELWKNNALMDIDYSKVAGAGRIVPELKTPYGVPQFFSTRVILYNPEKVTTPPTSYADLWNPAYSGRVGAIDIQYPSTIESAALAFGGSVSNYEPGKAKLLELKKAGLKIYPTNEAMAQALKSGECWICVMWQARGVQWQDAGIPIKIAFPKEGLSTILFSFVIPKNARNKPGAYAFMGAELGDDAQAGFAKAFGYNPVVRDVPLDPAYKVRIGIPADYQGKLLTPDNEYLSKNDAQLKDWWDKELKSA